jgi:hypothetical protein
MFCIIKNFIEFEIYTKNNFLQSTKKDSNIVHNLSNSPELIKRKAPKKLKKRKPCKHKKLKAQSSSKKIINTNDMLESCENEMVDLVSTDEVLK